MFTPPVNLQNLFVFRKGRSLLSQYLQERPGATKFVREVNIDYNRDLPCGTSEATTAESSCQSAKRKSTLVQVS